MGFCPAVAFDVVDEKDDWRPVAWICGFGCGVPPANGEVELGGGENVVWCGGAELGGGPPGGGGGKEVCPAEAEGGGENVWPWGW